MTGHQQTESEGWSYRCSAEREMRREEESKGGKEG